jgi:hypothetical protein
MIEMSGSRITAVYGRSRIGNWVQSIMLTIPSMTVCKKTHKRGVTVTMR